MKSISVIEKKSKNTFSFLAFLLLVCLSFTSLYGQAQERTVTLNVQNENVETVLKSIGKQVGVKFFYDQNIVSDAPRVTMNVKNASLKNVLDKVASQTKLVFNRNNNTITVGKQSVKSASKHIKAIKGKVVDSSGEPVIGANVLVKGTTNGVITDFDGNYALNDVPADATIQITYIGFRNVEMKADSKELVQVVLKEDSELLSEVVVVGYGSQKRANVTGAVATITAEDINNRPVTSAAGALQGADPSINLTINTGTLDSDYKIDIRGVASINGGSPLILADGMEVSLNQINPNDIESVSVLKDASAASIYGAKASSGVILITTKKGKDTKGKAVINYNGRMAWKQNTTSTDYITTGYDYVDMVNRFYESQQGKVLLTYGEEGMQLLYDRRNDKTENASRPWVLTDEKGKYMYYANYDWYGYMFKRTRPEQEHNISINGGTDKINYFISGRLLDQDGIFNIYEDNYKNYSFRAKVNAQLNERLHYTVGFNYNTNIYKYGTYESEEQTLFFTSYNIYPSIVPRNPDGTVVQYINQMSSNSPLGGGHAGMLTADKARNSRENSDWILTNQFDFKVLDGLTLTASYAYKNRGRKYTYRNMPFEYSRQEGVLTEFTSGTVRDYYKEIHRTVKDHNINAYATYEHLWNMKHNFKAVAGMQFEDYRADQLSAEKSDLLSESLSSMSVATGEMVISQDISAWRTLGFFTRVNYDYMGKYLLEMSGRWDGTSRFAAADRWGFFPSASLGWRTSEENFFEPLKDFWNSAKVRFSLGSLGNQQVDNYAYFDQISTDSQMSYTFDGLTKAYYAKVTNPKSANLTWETITTYNWGLDLGFFDNRLSVTADYFIRYTNDMLTTSLTLPSVFGANTPEANCANLRTNGWELYLGWNDSFKLAGKEFKYNVSATVGDYKSVITKYNNPDKLISDYYEGRTLGEIWGYKVGGLFATDEEAAAYQAEINDKAVNNRVYSSKTESSLKAGDVRFLDLDGDKVISEGSGTVSDPGDKRIIGNETPRYSYTFRLGAEYAGIDFSAFFQGVGKRDWYPTQYSYNFWGPYSQPAVSFIHKDFLDNCWSEENPDAYFPRQRGYQAYSAGSLGVVNDRYLQNAAYLRLKNITLGYTFPLKTKWLNKARVYVSGENLFYWSPIKKYSKLVDPELCHSTSTKYSKSGYGYGFSKTFSVGIDVTF